MTANWIMVKNDWRLTIGVNKFKPFSEWFQCWQNAGLSLIERTVFAA